MKIKSYMICLFFVGSCFQILGASEQKKNVNAVVYMGIPDKQSLGKAPLSLITKPEFDVSRLIGTPLVQVGSVQDLRRRGLEDGYSLVALHAFHFDDGEKRFLGVAPAGATLCQLPKKEDYCTLGYRCESGVRVFVALSREQTSRQLPEF